MDNQIVEFVVISESGEIIKRLKTNEKGYKKSIETGRIWYLHEKTGRLLPYEGKVKGGKNQPDKESGERTADEKIKDGKIGRDVLDKLAGIIKKRKRELPEGSYTSHLFREGKLKIRKKFGEESIELILAINREEIIYETADVIYHLFVLLESEGIGISEVFKELESRMDEQ